MLPRKDMKWMVSQPEHVLSRKTQQERFGGQYLFFWIEVRHSIHTVDTVLKHVLPNLPKMQSIIFQDIRKSIDEHLGVDYEGWREVNIMNTLGKIILESTDRILAGEPLCYNKAYRDAAASFANWTCTNTVLVGQRLPRFLQPFFGYLAAIPIYITQRKARGYLLPILKERMMNIARKRSEPFFDFEEPMDMISWMATEALNSQDARRSNPEELAEHLLIGVSNSRSEMKIAWKTSHY